MKLLTPVLPQLPGSSSNHWPDSRIFYKAVTTSLVDGFEIICFEGIVGFWRNLLGIRIPSPLLKFAARPNLHMSSDSAAIWLSDGFPAISLKGTLDFDETCLGIRREKTDGFLLILFENSEPDLINIVIIQDTIKNQVKAYVMLVILKERERYWVTVLFIFIWMTNCHYNCVK